MWVRGLKLDCLVGLVVLCGSHPMWVRGLKCKGRLITRRLIVAPHVGAWIEIVNL